MSHTRSDSCHRTLVLKWLHFTMHLELLKVVRAQNFPGTDFFKTSGVTELVFGDKAYHRP